MLTPKNLIESLVLAAKDESRGIYFISSPEQEDFLPYHELLDSAERVLAFLHAKGLEKGSAVIFQVSDEKDFIMLFWACILGGIIPVPLTVAKTQDQIAKLCKVAETVREPFVIGDFDHLSSVFDDEHCCMSDEVKFISATEMYATSDKGKVADIDGSDIAFIQFSSGSTGRPKGVVLTHHNLIANLSGISMAGGYSKSDRLLSWMPLTHDMGMIGFHLNPIFSGVDQFIIPTSTFIKKPSLWLEKASEHQITVTSSPNFGYKYLMLRTDLSQQDWELSSIRIIYNGAEPISVAICDEFLSNMKEFGLAESAMVPVYGLAEASVAVSMTDLSAPVEYITLDRDHLSFNDSVKQVPIGGDGVNFVNVGVPIPHCDVRIGDEKGKALKAGVIGSILIKGANVCQTYYNNSAAHDEIMRPEGWLDTGDLGFLWEGNLYITGRAKDIIFVNGQNFYAHDIESEAQKIPGIELNRIIVAGYSDQEAGTEQILAFVFQRGKLSSFIPLVNQLNEHMSKTYGFTFDLVVPVKNIPKTTSGKLQRFKMLNQYLQGEFQAEEAAMREAMAEFNQVEIVEPTNELEERILITWKTVLGITNIGTEHKFFEVGGNSLKATMLIAKLESTFKVKLTASQLYQAQSVKTLAGVIQESPKVAYEPIPTYPAQTSYPLSVTQKRIFLAWKLDQGATAYNMPVVFRLDGKVNHEKLANSLNTLVARHEVLRSTFSDGKEPTWQIQPQMEVDLKEIETDVLEDAIKQLIQPFNLEEGPLFRVAIINEAKEKYLFLDFHHIISDGHSVHHFMWELLNTYDAKPLESLPTNYMDFVQWQTEMVDLDLDKAKAFWKEKLKRNKPLELPLDHPRPNVLSFNGQRIVRTMNLAVSNALKSLAVEMNLTLHTVLMAAYHLLLHKYSKQDKICIGMPVHGRSHPDLQQLQGMFVNNLPIVNKIEKRTLLSEFLQQMQESVEVALQHQELAFDQMVRMIRSNTMPGRSPLFDTMFIFQNDEITGKRTQDFEVSAHSFDPGFSKFDLSLDVIDNGKTISYAFEYATDLFEEDTILSMANSFEKIVSQLLRDNQIKVTDLQLAEGYHEQSGHEQPTFVSVLDRFQMNVNEHPDAIALVQDQAEMNYATLHHEVAKAVQFLDGQGVGKGDIVVVHVPRSFEFIISVLGILHRGAVFVPVDPGLPMQHKLAILEDSACKSFIHSKDTVLETPETALGEKGIWVEDMMQEQQPAALDISIKKNDLAYVIYTSGTTGKPKGVMIGHESLANYINWACDTYIAEEVTTFPLYSSVSFDLTITSIFGPLVSGNKLVIYEEENEGEVLIKKVFEDNQADIVKLTPSHLRILINNDLITANTRIKRYILGGEALDTSLAQALTDQLADARIWNEYGPTEATVGCMIYQFTSGEQSPQVSIGKAIDNVGIYLLDEQRNPVAPGMVGEIFAGGSALAKGYLNQPEMTKARFVRNPFRKGEKMYRTGDLAKQKPNGNLEYLGRRDSQVKINGHRIELSHVENMLLQHEGVEDVSVVLTEDGSNMIAFYIANQPIDETLWRRDLSTHLPHYMMPSRLFEVASMPLTGNGKVDTKALLEFATLSVPTASELGSLTTPEQLLLEVWKEILEVDDISMDDNFYQLGGDSIKAVQIATRLFEAGYAVKTKDILLHHTIRQISPTVEALDQAQLNQSAVASGSMDLSPIQQWFFNQQLANPNFYHQSVILELQQEISVDMLNRSIRNLIQHHDNLRLNYDADNHQMVYNSVLAIDEFAVELHQVAQEKDAVAVCQDLKSSIEISNGFLISAARIQVQETGSTLLFITAHHLIVDGISWRVLLNDLQQGLIAGANGKALQFKQKTASYQAYVNYLNQEALLTDFRSERAYWGSTTSKQLTIPADTEVGPGTVATMEVEKLVIDEVRTSFLLTEAHGIYNTDMPILLNAVLLRALKDWTGKQSFLIEQENHGRNLEGIDIGGTIGWFTAIYPVKLDYQEDLAELIKSVKETFRQVPNDGMGYGINKYLGAGLPEIPTAFRFNYLGQFGEELNNDLFRYLPDFDHGADSAPENALTAQLELNCLVLNNQLSLSIQYNSQAYRASKMKFLLQLFEQHLAEVITHIKNQDEVDYTPSDFTYASLDNEEMDALFN